MPAVTLSSLQAGSSEVAAADLAESRMWAGRRGRRAGCGIYCRRARRAGRGPLANDRDAECFFDESGGMQLVIHAPFGGRINKAWGLALRKRFCRSFNLELQAAATDDGLNISLTEQHSFPLAEVFHFLYSQSVDQVVEQSALASPIFATRWRCPG